jgi:hypothetical protein
VHIADAETGVAEPTIHNASSSAPLPQAKLTEKVKRLGKLSKNRKKQEKAVKSDDATAMLAEVLKGCSVQRFAGCAAPPLFLGWALTRERNEITNARDERVGKLVARQLAPMISQFIREQ